jgi:hypothetical protein
LHPEFDDKSLRCFMQVVDDRTVVPPGLPCGAGASWPTAAGTSLLHLVSDGLAWSHRKTGKYFR